MPASTCGADFRLTLITADPGLAAEADAAGVNRIGIDLEHLEKAERQAGRDTRISRHRWTDLLTVARVIRRARPFVRINPVHPGTAEEVETAIGFGAAVVMLPYFSTVHEVERFIQAVDGRASAVILVEQAAAVARIRDILAVGGIDEVMLGLNDLHLQFRVRNHFEMLVSPVVDMLASEVHAKGLPLAIGGVARADDASLPVSGDLVLAQYPRLGATGAWIARSFLSNLPASVSLADAVGALRNRLEEWACAPADTLTGARAELALAASAWQPPVTELGRTG
jgi:citrate lyase beta subunit